MLAVVLEHRSMDAMGLAAACCIIGVCRAIGSWCGARVWLIEVVCMCVRKPAHKCGADTQVHK